MKEDFFISIMQKYGIEDKVVIQKAYQDILHNITQEQQIIKECKSNLEKMIGKLSRDILNFQYAVSKPIFLYKNCLESKCKQNQDIYLWQLIDNIKMYASFLERRMNGVFRIKIVGNDIKISLIKKRKKMASIAADAINNSIFSDVQYDATTGYFTIATNITDGRFFERHSIIYCPSEADARRAIFSGVMKDKKIKFNLTIGKEEILTGFDILMEQMNEGTGISQILHTSLNKANKTYNGKQ